jgi:hypothetical protein
MRLKLSYGESPPLHMTLIYIDAYGISTFNVSIRLEEKVAGSTLPIMTITREIRRVPGISMSPLKGSDDIPFQTPVKYRIVIDRGMNKDTNANAPTKLKYTSE